MTDNSSKSPPRMWTLTPTAELFKERDPSTAVTKHWIRSLVLEGKVPSVMVGRKRLINVDALIDYIASCGSTAEQTQPKSTTGGIRRVGEKL